jgi:PIN domain nuclease of toxin-antitoxin system
MRYLLDTHAALWYFEGSPNLGKSAIQVIENPAFLKCLSVASLWEVSIKLSLGKLRFEGGVPRFASLSAENGFEILPITIPDLTEVSELPFQHRDPFDRLLVAVARMNGLTILTTDNNIKLYEVPTLW